MVKKKVSLSSQLGVPEEKKIPISLLEKVSGAEVGSRVKSGSKNVVVTRQLKHRAKFVLEIKKL